MPRPLIGKGRSREEAAFARAVRTRDGYRCLAENSIDGRDFWVRCAKRATDPHHVVKRALCGRAKFVADVGLMVCRACHTALHAYDRRVRVPREAMQRAVRAIARAENKLALPLHRARR